MTEPDQYYQPSYVPYSRNNDIRYRGQSSEWLKMQNRIDNVPSYQAQESTRQQSMMEGKGMEPLDQKGPNQKKYENLVKSQSAQQTEEMQSQPQASFNPLENTGLAAASQSAPYRAFADPNRTDTHYSRYMQLSQNVAYRHPDPGPPRHREGAIGGSWRHIKEVLGHSGSRVVFVDGLVSLYDIDKRMLGRKNLAMRASVQTPLYSANRHDSDTYGKILRNDLEKEAYQPWEDKITNTKPLPAINSTTKELPGSPSKYKGFYNISK